MTGPDNGPPPEHPEPETWARFGIVAEQIAGITKILYNHEARIVALESRTGP